MAVNEELNSGEISAEYAPQIEVSDVIVDSYGKGRIFLEVLAPSGRWTKIASQSGAYSVSTPDSALLYRFRASQNIEQPTRVYMGP